MKPSPILTLLEDWHAETQDLVAILQGLTEDQWEKPTPAPGWRIKHQVAHLDWTEQMVLLSLSDEAGFAQVRKSLPDSSDLFVDQAARQGARQTGRELLSSWESTQSKLHEKILSCEAGQRVTWFGPAMGLATVLSARIMEIFAHGQDVRDTLGLAPNGSHRLRHIAHLAVTARDFSFKMNDLPVPDREFRIELDYEGQRWTWGPEEAPERVEGLALDFGLLATRRRHRDDCAVTAQGQTANQWLNIIQAYAGSPGEGRAPK